MRKITLLLLTIATFLTSYSQDLPDFEAIKLDAKEDYNANANNAALQAVNYLFSTPFEKNNDTRLKCARYIVKWMSGTPDYTFNLNANSMKYIKKDGDLMILSMAAMAKYALENKADAGDDKKVMLNAVKILIQYAKVPANNIKLNSELKKAIEADEKGQLQEYLNL